MKLLVLGATGGIGLEIVRQALENGHTVTALVRTPERLQTFRERITVIQGNLLNSTELGHALEEQDAVLSGFGPRLPLSKSDDHLLEEFATVLTGTMPHSGVKRAVIVSTAFLFKDAVLPPAHLFGKLFFPSVVMDATRMEAVFEKSKLDWTMVRPPQLTNKPYAGKYRMRVGHLPNFGFSISRADVADYMMKAVSDPSSIRKVIGVSD